MKQFDKRSFQTNGWIKHQRDLRVEEFELLLQLSDLMWHKNEVAVHKFSRGWGKHIAALGTKKRVFELTLRKTEQPFFRFQPLDFGGCKAFLLKE